jgi:hypothetical protein
VPRESQLFAELTVHKLSLIAFEEYYLKK